MVCCGSKNEDQKYQGKDLGDPNYEGEETDARLKDGPLEERHCTDVLCCLIFIAFFGVMGYVSMEGYSKGYQTNNYQQLVAVYDGSGNSCQYAPGYEGYNYLYFWLPIPGYLHKTTCVKACPQIGVMFSTDKAKQDEQMAAMYENPVTGAAPSAANQLDCKTNKYVTQCYGRSANMMDISSFTSDVNVMNQTYIIYPTIPKFYRFCVPDQVNQTLTQYSSQVTSYLASASAATQAVNDIDKARWLILGSCLMALLLGFSWMVIMKMCAAFMTWLLILLTLVFAFACSYFMYQEGVDYQKTIDGMPASQEKPTNYYKYVSWVFIALSTCYFLFMCCMFSRIQIAIKIMETSADFVTEVIFIMAVPPVITLFITVWTLYWTVIMVFVYSLGTFQVAGDGLFYGQVIKTDVEKYMMWTWVFAFLWINAFLNALNQFIISSSAAIWYFSPRDPENENDKIVNKAVTRSVYRAFRYHLGTLALGSFILAFVQLLQLIMGYIHKQLKESGATDDNKALQYALYICQSYLACFERCVRFMNKNAYIQCAITSNNFCISCRDGFFLCVRNSFLFAIAAGIGEVFIMVGKTFITCMSVFLMYYLNTVWWKVEMYNVFWPFVIIGILSYIVGQMFMTVWGMGADAILMCFCIDKELNKDSQKENKYSPNQLLAFIQDEKTQKTIAKAEFRKKRQQEDNKRMREENPPKKGLCNC